MLRALILLVALAAAPTSAWSPALVPVPAGGARRPSWLPRIQQRRGVALSIRSSAPPGGRDADVKELVRLAGLAVRDPKKHEAALVRKAEELEARNPCADPAMDPLLSGNWALLYTASGDKSAARQGGSSALQAFLDKAYDFTYQYFPEIAGRSPTKSFQRIDLEGGRVHNVVEGGKGRLGFEIDVAGSVRRNAEKPGQRIDVTFESFSLAVQGLPALVIPLPRPQGSLDITYLDDTVRISRGNRQSLFVTVRSKKVD